MTTTNRKTAKAAQQAEPVVNVETVNVRELYQAERDAREAIDRTSAALGEARAAVNAAHPDRDVSAADLAEMERQEAFAQADLDEANRKMRVAERDIRQGLKVNDATAAEHAATLLRDSLGKALGIEVPGVFTVKAAGPVILKSEVYRTGDVTVRYDGDVNRDIVALAVSKALGIHGGGQVLLGAGPWTVKGVTVLDEELNRQFLARREEEDRQHRIRMRFATSGYGGSSTGTL